MFWKISALVLLVAALICAIGWVCAYTGMVGVLYCMKKNGFPLPSDAELKEGTRWAAQEIFSRTSTLTKH